jgi:hypothetical protein
VSYLYYTVMGAVLVIVVSCILSFIFGFQDAKTVDRRLVAPFMRKYIEFESVRDENLRLESGQMMRIYELKEVEE